VEPFLRNAWNTLVYVAGLLLSSSFIIAMLRGLQSQDQITRFIMTSSQTQHQLDKKDECWVPSWRRLWQTAWRVDKRRRECHLCRHFQTPSTPTTQHRPGHTSWHRYHMFVCWWINITKHSTRSSYQQLLAQTDTQYLVGVIVADANAHVGKSPG